MTPSGVMIIGYPALVFIIAGAALIGTLVAALAIRRLPRWRILALVLIFLALASGLTAWFYFRYQILPLHIEVINGL